ncbi:MAG: TIGR04282 family arsenosugar biosynthesis glycosyltransferase [Planctomycetes bacterium]|nr:TIGR04282 family arsenosugar biosynthesis glycosyltransferase [Planctomycetota bacterium]
MKTRLAASVGEDAAAGLYAAMAADTLEAAARVSCDERRILYSPPGTDPESFACLLPPGRTSAFRLLPQSGGDLGQRLCRAFRNARRSGLVRRVAVGTDCPQLDPRALSRSLDLLDRFDLVLGPARDGGYYLIGVRGCTGRLFSGVPWSTGRVLEATLQRACEARLRTVLLEERSDVDSIDDLRNLGKALLPAWGRGRGHFPRHTFRELAYREWQGGAPAAASSLGRNA